MRSTPFVFLLFLLPAIAFAQAIFPSSSLWVSDTAPKEGQSVTLYTVIYNGGEETLKGSLRFFIGEDSLTAQSIELARGTSQIYSAHWSAKAGTHTVRARFTPLDEQKDPQDSAVLTVSVATPPSPTTEAIHAMKETGASIASSAIPFLQRTGNAIFDATESARLAGIEYLEKRTGSVAGASTSTSSGTTGFQQNASPQKHPTLSRVGQAAAAAALFTLQNRWLYYSLIVLTLYLLLRAARRFVNRPRF